MNPNAERQKEERLAGVMAALRRAAQRARLVAQQTGTPLVISKNGRVEMQWLEGEAGAGRREDFEKYLAAVPDVAPPANDRLD